MVSNNMIKKWPINASTNTNIHIIFGTNLAGNRGKTVRQKTDRVVMDYVTVLKDFIKLNKFVTLVADAMSVNGATFLITMSHGIKFVTVKKYQPIQLIN